MGGSSYLSASSETEFCFRTVRVSERKHWNTMWHGWTIHSPPISLNQACSTYILIHVTEATNCYCKSVMTWTFPNSVMFFSVIKVKNLQLYKKLQNLLSMFQKLKSSGFKFERFGGEKTQSSRFVFDRFFEKICKTRYTRRATPGGVGFVGFFRETWF